MEPSSINEAARLLAGARRERRPLAALPSGSQPSSFSEALAIQEATVAALGETVVGYKVAGTDPVEAMWAPVLSTCLFSDPAVIPASQVPLLGIEVEIAYRLERELAAADRAMNMAMFDRCTSVVPAIEVVDTRFANYAKTPLLHRAADLMSNGALVCGEPWADAAAHDLEKLAVRLWAGKALLADTVGGHSAIDPRRPALAFIQAAGRPDRLPRNTLITTGTYTGLLHARPGDTVTAGIAGYGTLTVSFPA